METPEERALFKKGEENYQAKKALRTRSLLQKAPDAEESNLIHSMWTKEVAYMSMLPCPNTNSIVEIPDTNNADRNNPTQRPPNMAYMSDTVLKSAMIMQPQDRNRHSFMIFGGFLLKQTFELAFCCAASFSHSRPNFLALDPSTFENPVPVGSVLYLRATVEFTEPYGDPQQEQGQGQNQSSGSSRFTKVQVRVDSKVRDVEHGTKNPTGMFHYTFLVEKDIQVMPKEYTEFMMWTDARRRTQNFGPKWSALRAIKDSVTE